MARPDIEGMDEDERLAILEKLDGDHPGRELSSRAAGRLAGPATKDRPDVPIWNYLGYLASHPDADTAELIAIRFPVIFFGGNESTIESAEEFLLEGPVAATNPPTFESVVGMWQYLHAAAVVRWNSELRAVEHIQPFERYRKALREWREVLRSTPGPTNELF
jgi:hypothetical protein